MKRRDFICGLSCMLAGFGLCEAKTKMIPQKKCNNPKQEDYIPSTKGLQEIYIQATSHCNLNCISCDAFSPVAKPEFVTFEKFSKDFHKIKELFPDRNMDLVILGGEPLLNPDLTKIINLYQKLFPKGKKNIFTNGILLPKMDEDFWKALKNANFDLTITYHPIDIDRSIAENLAKKYEINLIKNIITTNVLYDLNTHKISRHVETIRKIEPPYHVWGKTIIDLSGSQDYVEKRYVCYRRDMGASYIRGNLYFCHEHAHVNALIDNFNLDIPITKDDYITIADVKSAKEIDDFINSPKPLCRYCKQDSSVFFNGKPIEWEFSKKQLSEWV